MRTKKGDLLISNPRTIESIFFKSVILITQYNSNESIGFIINKKSKISLNNILDDFDITDIPLYIGGPVAKNTLHFIHTLGSIIPGSTEIIDNLYWGGDFELIKKLLNKNKISRDEIRFFIGYSGWGKNQLRDEINKKEWYIVNGNKDILNNYSSEDLWSKIIKQLPEEYAVWANLPKDPELN